MVLKAAAEDALAVAVQRGRDRIAWLRFDHPFMEAEFQPRFSPGKKVSKTSFDTVLRTASSHCRQPER